MDSTLRATSSLARQVSIPAEVFSGVAEAQRQLLASNAAAYSTLGTTQWQALSSPAASLGALQRLPLPEIGPNLAGLATLRDLQATFPPIGSLMAKNLAGLRSAAMPSLAALSSSAVIAAPGGLADAIRGITAQEDSLRSLLQGLKIDATWATSLQATLDAIPNVEALLDGEPVITVPPEAAAAVAEAVTAFEADPEAMAWLEELSPQRFALLLACVAATPIIATHLAVEGRATDAAAFLVGCLWALLTLGAP